MKKIMIVEDNFRARRALKALLAQQTGINVMAEASNGQEAIRKIGGTIPDLVLMDMRMPIMDGLEATKIIKKNWPQIRIVMLTMYPECQSDVIQAGVDAFLVKGCSVDEMAAAIHSLN
jgi:DNA-binding NarL/FixJ family response regulator